MSSFIQIIINDFFTQPSLPVSHVGTFNGPVLCIQLAPMLFSLLYILCLIYWLQHIIQNIDIGRISSTIQLQTLKKAVVVSELQYSLSFFSSPGLTTSIVDVVEVFLQICSRIPQQLTGTKYCKFFHKINILAYLNMLSDATIGLHIFHSCCSLWGLKMKLLQKCKKLQF